MARSSSRRPATKTTKAKTARAAPKTTKTTRRAATPRTPPTPRTVTPYLALNDARSAIDWYKTSFGAKVVGEIQPGPGGRVMHAELKIGDSSFFVSDIFPGSDMTDATRFGTPVNINLFHKDADKLWDRAVGNGAKVTMPFEDQFWGNKYGRVLDPYGHSWALVRNSKLSKKELEVLRVKAIAQMGGPQ